MIQKKISYRPLWNILESRSLPYSYLCYNDIGLHITTRSLARMRQDQGVSIETLLRVCAILDVNLGDICETITIKTNDE